MVDTSAVTLACTDCRSPQYARSQTIPTGAACCSYSDCRKVTPLWLSDREKIDLRSPVRFGVLDPSTDSTNVGRPSLGWAGSSGVPGAVAGADIASRAMICTLPRWYGIGSSETWPGSSPVRLAMAVT